MAGWVDGWVTIMKIYILYYLITYLITRFYVHKPTLLCFVMQPLDFEAQAEFILKLTVENVNPLSNKAQNLPLSTGIVRVTVINENEPPHFREDPIQIVVPESVLPGTLLKTNYAFDPDNSDLRYDAETGPKYFNVE